MGRVYKKTGILGNSGEEFKQHYDREMSWNQATATLVFHGVDNEFESFTCPLVTS